MINFAQATPAGFLYIFDSVAAQRGTDFDAEELAGIDAILAGG
jgi:hypothetical protein